MTDDFETGAIGARGATVGAEHRSVRAEWTLLGTFVDASFVGLDDLVRPLPVSRLLDEFSLAMLLKRDVLVRPVDWPAAKAAAISLDASFSVTFDGNGERAGISMVAIDPRSKASCATRGDSVAASLKAHVAQAVQALPALKGAGAGKDDTEAARSIASAMITLAGSLRDLSERYGSPRSARESDGDGDGDGEPTAKAAAPPPTDETT